MADITIDDFQEVLVNGLESTDDDRVTGNVVAWAIDQVDKWIDGLYDEYPAGYEVEVKSLLTSLHVVFAEEQFGFEEAGLGDEADEGVIGLSVFEVLQGAVDGEFDSWFEVEL